ncbi:vacuolar atp synthase subunit c [Moniliophthora roreri]|nr:vacuolar atp synthase subunit c [Moniliophthora roreri]
MPSDQSTWLISVPLNGDSEGLSQELSSKLSQQSRSFSPNSLGELPIPSFKTGTLDSLISLSEELPKQDTYFTNTVAKIVDTLRNLLNNDPSKLSQHILVNERSVDDHILRNWKWNEGRYGVQKSLKEMVDTLNKEMASIDNAMKSKLTNYNLVKGSLVQMQRKKTGNLSVRSLVDLVSKDDFVQDSEYLETVLVAVPKSAVKLWNTKYERLASMVVPRSSRLITSDDEYSLFSAVIFRRVHDEFAQQCRENKFILRDFTELLHLSRTNFSESLQVLVHLKIIRLFVESVLRYGLPANYVGVAIKPDPKSTKKIFSLLQSHFSYLRSGSKGAKAKSGETEEFAGEYQTLMEQEFYDFVIYEVPWILT